MRELIAVLNAASEAYYNGSETMDNLEYDRLFDELMELEQKTGHVFPDSPTQRAGYTVAESLPKVTHEFPTLSLDKTKDIEVFSTIFDVRDRKAVVMWKMDGSTIINTYEDGHLITTATRGNGLIGSDITHNAPFIKGLPQEIAFKGKLVVRGEAVMSYSSFNRINESLDPEEQYKNPRNLANASISLLNSREMSRRNIEFFAFKLVFMEETGDAEKRTGFEGDMQILKKLGFQTVEYETGYAGRKPVEGIRALREVMEDFSGRVPEYDFPVDGLVVAANDTVYAESRPGTGHNPNKLVGYALKWQDETAETVLRNIEWQASRTGLLNPVAVFDPVELEGTTCTKATLHNVSYIRELDLKTGDRILVYKANKIIPKVAENLSKAESTDCSEEAVRSRYHFPEFCPVCGEPTDMTDASGNGSIVLMCPNEECPAKMIGRFIHFCERDCMNIIGLSEATIEKFVDSGFIGSYADFWKLGRYEAQIVEMEGFGKRSFANLQDELEKARVTTFARFVNALGIPNVGVGQSGLLFRYFREHLPVGEDIVKAVRSRMLDEDYSFTEIEGIGTVIDRSLHEWGSAHFDGEAGPLLEILEIADRIVPEREEMKETAVSGKVFVVTGDVYHFKNRKELQKKIEEYGGKVTGSVSKKTDFLINNDAGSSSAKNQKAKELQIPIITEEDFLAML